MFLSTFCPEANLLLYCSPPRRRCSPPLSIGFFSKQGRKNRQRRRPVSPIGPDEVISLRRRKRRRRQGSPTGAGILMRLTHTHTQTHNLRVMDLYYHSITDICNNRAARQTQLTRAMYLEVTSLLPLDAACHYEAIRTVLFAWTLLHRGVRASK